MSNAHRNEVDEDVMAFAQAFVEDNITGLVRIANEMRSASGEPPFAVAQCEPYLLGVAVGYAQALQWALSFERKVKQGATT